MSGNLTPQEILDDLSDQNHQHMVMTSRITYAIQWLPEAIFAMEGMTLAQAQARTLYWQIGLLYRVSNTESVHGLFPQGVQLAEINRLLEEVEMEGFRTANDSLSHCHPELMLGEAWLCNADDEGWENISFQSKRRGQIAYDRWHEPMEGNFPVFVQKTEYVARGSPGALAH